MDNQEADQFEMQLESIKRALLSLKPSGADGFEGLLRLVLTKLTNIPFRLATSGLQGGKDGDAVSPRDAVSFEAKRYSDKIDRNDVLVKIADLARNKEAADRLWILGATIEISTQLTDQVHQDGDRNAISTLILDWTLVPLPLLAAAVVNAAADAIDFLIAHQEEKPDRGRLSREDLVVAFKSVSEHDEFFSTVEWLKSNLCVSKLAFARAIEQNTQWRKETFGSVSKARDRLRQPLSIAVDASLPQLRSALRQSLSSSIKTGNDVVLLGDEGNGKSWLAAQLCAETEGMALFISAERFDSVAPDDLEALLIELLIKQSGDLEDDALRSRWRHRIAAWKSTPALSPFLVVVDGVNQRQNLRWDRLLNSLQVCLADIGGRLVVTARPTFWQKSVKRGLWFFPEVIEVPEWAADERDVLLKHYRVDRNWLDSQTLKTLLNPRLLGVAVEVLPHQDAQAWKGLTTDRILMEHLRLSQRENFEIETFNELTTRLSEHAEKVLEHAQRSSARFYDGFLEESNAVIETRFFQPVSGPGDLYVLREEGLTLAIGFTLVDRLWQTYRKDGDLSNQIVQLIEPINALDRTADIVFAALWVCALDEERFNTAIFRCLLDAFSNLQNVSDQRFEEFVEISKHQPGAFYDLLKELCLEKGRRINVDWFVQCAFEVSRTADGWRAAEAAIRRWLKCYNKDPIEQVTRYHNNSDSEYKTGLLEQKRKIEEALSALSSYEKGILQQMTEVSGELDDLITLALQLLAGRSLATFAGDFIAMGLAFSLNTRIYSAHTAFDQLTRFNRVDIANTSSAFFDAIKPLRAPETSKGGKWTVVRMLYATRDENAAVEANTLAEELRRDWPYFEPPSPNEWRQVKVADPDAGRPVDLEDGTQRFIKLEASKILQTMGVGSDDWEYRTFLPVACRFEPKVAVEKTRDILYGLVTRTELPLRQVILNCGNHVPLVDQNMSIQIINRFEKDDPILALSEREQLACRLYAFKYVAPQASAEQQLICMKGKALGPGCSLSVVPCLKSQRSADIVRVLQEELGKSDEDAVYGALCAALHGYAHITGDLEALIIRCCATTSPRLRALSYQLALDNELASIRKSHAESNWAAGTDDDNIYEVWSGSELLIEACANGELSADQLFRRISPEVWFLVADRLGLEFARLVAKSFLGVLREFVGSATVISPPLVDLTLSVCDPLPYPLISAEDSVRTEGRFPQPKNLTDIFGDLDGRQEKLRETASEFLEKLRGSNAKQLIQKFGIENLRCLTNAAENLLSELSEILSGAADAQFIWLRNLAFCVANLLSKENPEKSVALMRRAIQSQGFLTLNLGDDLTLEHQAVWSSSESELIRSLWRQRLMGSPCDAVLAQEVLAAERFGAADFIRSMVLELYSSQDSLDKAYAISIIGFSSRCADMANLIHKHVHDKSIPGAAAKQSLVFHNNARWANLWSDQMWNAPDDEEFWRCLMIAKTCMDARVCDKPKTNSKWRHYVAVFRDVRSSAIKERSKDLQKKLLGAKAPDKIFLNSSF